MKRPLAWVFVAMSLVGCGEDACVHRSTKYYHEALSRQLTANGVRHSVDGVKGICLSSNQKAQLDVAERQVDSYFNEVATLLEDECEERALVSWARQESLSFDVADTRNSRGEPGRRMFLIRSFSRDEAEANRKKLLEKAPKGVKCAK